MPAWEGIFRIFEGDGSGYFLHPGEQVAGRTGGSGASGVSPVLELRGEKGIFRNGDVYEGRTCLSDYGLGIEEHDHEGRVITAEFPEYYVVTCYTPNSQDGLKRLDYRMQWEDAFRTYLKELEKKKPVIFCGDLNVAHNEIDLKNPKTNRKNAGFSDEERAKFTELLGAGFIDTFRYFYPDQEGIYSWWSYRFSARAKNAGWRIDYFCVSESLKDRLLGAKIHTEIMGSDHCPVELDID